ncbi:uncharacterized protein LOC110858690 isoform X1 [Folsomia candida]|nr:uncharacterized protein LOC110858690 isoform X1 [Folsomia candida]
MDPNPKCYFHKGEQIGFVLAQFTDGANKKNDVILHVISSFKYIHGDNEGRSQNATRSIILQNLTKSELPWKSYSKEREAAKKPAAELVEIQDRRLYFDDEDEMMKVYAARQTTTLFQLLLWPDTTIKIICLNLDINLPNGAYKELVEEMDLCGLELKIHDKLSPSAAAAIDLEAGEQIPYLLHAKHRENIGALLTRGRKENKEKVAALYFVSNPHIIYAGQALNSNVHTKNLYGDPVLVYKTNKPSTHPEHKLVPVGLVREEERYKWECHLHICALIASLLKLKNCITPDDFSAQSHPLCINKKINSSYVDKKSWGIVHGIMMEKFLVDVYLGPRTSD